VDALEPAAAAAAARSGAPLAEALSAAAEAARQGVEKTRDMLAALGKARTLGERARGHVDPGAESTRLILDLMREAVATAGGEGRT
jgi:dihydroxyacetone kinase-like protein